MIENHLPFRTPPNHLQMRLEALKAELIEKRLGAAWIAYTTDLLYFTGSAQDGVLLVYSEGNPDFFVRKSLSRAIEESAVTVKPYPGRKELFDLFHAKISKLDGRFGLPFDVTPTSTYLWLCKNLSGCDPVDLSGPIRMLKAVKDAWEIEQVALATDQVAEVFKRAPELIRPEMTELELTGKIEGVLRSLGHGGPLRIRRHGMELAMLMAVSGQSALTATAFDGPVGGEGPYPGAAPGPGWNRLQKGSTVMLDIVTSYNAYHSDNARTFFLGRNIPTRVLAAHEFCLRALERIEELMKPGAVCSEIFRSVNEWAQQTGEPEGFMGFGENRVKFFGHGVGLELDEMPVLADRIDMELAPGMVVAVEPKAFLTGIGPVGVENTYRITQTGCGSFLDAPLEIGTIE